MVINKPKKIFSLISCSEWDIKTLSPQSNKNFKTMPIWNYTHTTVPFRLLWSRYYGLFQEFVTYGFLDLELMFFLEEAWSTLNGNVCSQNNTYSFSKKTHTIQEDLLQDFKFSALVRS